MSTDFYIRRRTYLGHASRALVTVTPKPAHINEDRVTYVVEELGQWKIDSENKWTPLRTWIQENYPGLLLQSGPVCVDRSTLKSLLDVVSEESCEPSVRVALSAALATGEGNDDGPVYEFDIWS